jgi:hypothetical protein
MYVMSQNGIRSDRYGMWADSRNKTCLECPRSKMNASMGDGANSASLNLKADLYKMQHILPILNKKSH